MCTKKNVNRNNFSQKESLSFSVLDTDIILTSGSTKKYYLVMVIKSIQKTSTFLFFLIFFKKKKANLSVNLPIYE